LKYESDEAIRAARKRNHCSQGTDGEWARNTEEGKSHVKQLSKTEVGSGFDATNPRFFERDRKLKEDSMIPSSGNYASYKLDKKGNKITDHLSYVMPRKFGKLILSHYHPDKGAVFFAQIQSLKLQSTESSLLSVSIYLEPRHYTAFIER
jgi:hypothetical protein